MKLLPWVELTEEECLEILSDLDLYPRGFDFQCPPEKFSALKIFLDDLGVFWYRVTHWTEPVYFMSITKTYDLLQEREACR